jgi:hypothetical protein
LKPARLRLVRVGQTFASSLRSNEPVQAGQSFAIKLGGEQCDVTIKMSELALFCHKYNLLVIDLFEDAAMPTSDMALARSPQPVQPISGGINAFHI